MALHKRLGARLMELFRPGRDSDEFYEELEDLLIEADIGASLAMEIGDTLRKRGRLATREQLVTALREILLDGLMAPSLELDPGTLNIILVLGVNGVGKTTSIAKLARLHQTEWPQAGITIAAGDTFRAAAIEQLEAHGERLGVRVIKQSSGSDAGAVIYDAITSARARGDRLLLADTAGRMHNRADLVRELEKIHAIVLKQDDGSFRYRKLLVIDATTGQNAFQQAEMFHQAVGVDAVMLAKYDSSARGGILVSLSRRIGLGCAFLGTGESYDAIRRFDPERYVDEILAP